MNWTLVGIAALFLIELLVVVRVMLRPHRDPSSRVAWIAVITFMPGLGIIAYVLFGEVNIGRRRVARMREVIEAMPALPSIDSTSDPSCKPNIPSHYLHLFRAGQSVNGFEPVDGNTASLMPDSNATIDSMVADIDAATDHVHLLFYIWLPDNNGLKMVEALRKAASRGVTCRVMVDDLGSRSMVRSKHWKSLQDSGVQVAVALPIGNPLLKPLRGRIDLRNHRKILVIDGRITYCGSQNCADPEFRIKAKFAPWVDAVMRIEGPVVVQNQYLFASDWMSEANENLDQFLSDQQAVSQPGFTAQVIATGPTVRYSAMPEVFESLFHAARRELVVSTPYYVPDTPLQNALCAAAHRGVDTTIIFPAKNDSWIVGAASRSYYMELLDAGVKIFEFVGGLLHTKSLTLDGDISLIGSANLDRRSFELNYENNILFYDPKMTAALRQRQQAYLEQSQPVLREEVAAWPITRKLWNNTIATLGPIL